MPKLHKPLRSKRCEKPQEPKSSKAVAFLAAIEIRAAAFVWGAMSLAYAN
jgi:hypothetical protein